MEIPITKPYFDENEYLNLKQVLDSGWVAQGKMTEEFEKEAAAHEGIRYGVAVSSCTTALHLALEASGIGMGDDVLVPAFTFVATANSVCYTGAVPILVDIDLATFNISIEEIKKKIDQCYRYDTHMHSLINRTTGNRLKAILPVHQFGLCADMREINEIAGKYNLVVIEDAACALGAKIDEIHQGKFGNISCVSFHPRKCITTGEGGMIFTDDPQMYEKLKMLRSHGAAISEVNRHSSKGGFLLPDYPELGYNYRLSDIQSALGLAQIKKLDDILAKRRKAAETYKKLMSGFHWLSMPAEPEGYWHTYQSFVCMLQIENTSVEEQNNRRNQMMSILESSGVHTRQGTHAVHLLGYYKQKYGYKEEDYPNAYKADRLSISLPLYVGMEEADQIFVAHTLEEALIKLCQ